MITEIMEAGYYSGEDERLAAPLIEAPFTHGFLGALMPQGSDELLQFVNNFILQETLSGRISELTQEYIYVYTGEDASAEEAAAEAIIEAAEDAAETTTESTDQIVDMEAVA